MDRLTKLLRSAPRLSADNRLWEKIEHSLQNSSPSLAWWQHKSTWGAVAAAITLIFGLTVFPTGNKQAELEEWSILYSQLLTEESFYWDETSSLSGELTQTLIAWVDINKGDRDETE